jgi:branched-chain amino acid transport system substrate-binding protein
MLKCLKLILICSWIGILVTCTKEKQSYSQNEIRVGQVDAFTGPQASFGLSIKTGIELAFETTNQAGAIFGKKLRLITKNDRGEPAESVAAAKQLINDDQVIAILGASASTRSLQMAAVAQSQQIPMISPSSTNPKVTEVGNYIFRVCFIDTFQGAVMARFARDTLQLKKVAVLRDAQSEYSIGLADFFTKKWKELGGVIVADLSYRAEQLDFVPQIKAIAAAKSELIYVPGYYTDVAHIVLQARKMGIAVPFAGGDGWDSNELYNIGGETLEASYFTNHYSANNQDPVHLKFAKAYSQKFGTAPNADAALGYDAAMVLIGALKRAKSLVGADLRDAIAVTKDFPGVTGRITLDEKRNAVKSAVVMKVQGKKAVYVQTVNP